MRDPNRLVNFYNEVMTLHMKYIPDWREGQFLYNFWAWLASKNIDPFYYETDDMLDLIKEFLHVD